MSRDPLLLVEPTEHLPVASDATALDAGTAVGGPWCGGRELRHPALLPPASG